MESSLGQSVVVAETYAEALLPLAQEAGEPTEVLEELEQVTALLRDIPGFALWHASPVLPEQRKLACLARALRNRVSDLTCDTLMVIARHGRLNILGQIVSAFRRRIEAEQGWIPVEITSAAPLDEQACSAISAVLAGKLGAKPVLNKRVDPSILGGLIVRVGDEVTNLSVSGQLQQFRQVLTRRLTAALADGRQAPKV